MNFHEVLRQLPIERFRNPAPVVTVLRFEGVIASRPSRNSVSLASHAAALAYVDSQLPPLFDALRRRGPALAIVCSDHGTAYGEDGYSGHRVAHPVVWTVPYAEFLLEGRA